MVMLDADSMILLIFPLLLHFSSADYLIDHLAANLNHTIDPCDDFFRHVCSQSIDEEQFPLRKIENFYFDIAQNYEHISESPNFAILNDIAIVQETTQEDKPYFNHSNFRKLVEARCLESDECYREEFEFYYSLYDELNDKNNRLEYLLKNLEKTSRGKILDVLPLMIDSVYTEQFNETEVATEVKTFYEALINRLFVMEELNNKGVFDNITHIEEDISVFKELILEKFRLTPWMNEKDDLGLSFLSEFEDKINDMVVHYDLDENDHDLKLLRKINGEFLEVYYSAKRPTGVDVLDILFALHQANEALKDFKDPEKFILVERIRKSLHEDAFYNYNTNRLALMAPYIYPQLTDDHIMKKPFVTLQTIGHEMFHSVVLKDWADKSPEFRNGMDCLNDHFDFMCSKFRVGSCNSGPQTFEEDGPDVEGLRIAYEFLIKLYKQQQLEDVIFETESFSVNIEKAFFYLYGISYCSKIKKESDHTDEHTQHHVRVNGDMKQMPEFTKAFKCSPDQQMYSVKEKTCHLFGPNAK